MALHSFDQPAIPAIAAKKHDVIDLTGNLHDIDGQLSLVIIEGEGEFLGEGDAAIPAKAGDVAISEIAEPHGLRAKTDLRLLVTIAPPI